MISKEQVSKARKIIQNRLAGGAQGLKDMDFALTTALSVMDEYEKCNKDMLDLYEKCKDMLDLVENLALLKSNA